MNELTHVDLFSGIGGFAIAAKRAGFRTVSFAEVEPYACGILKRRRVPNLGDVRQPGNFSRFRGATVLSAGYPCQPASLAGKRRGEEDHRWLWPPTCDIVATVRPAWFIGENVFGHVSMGLDRVLLDLESLGYATQSFVIPACAVGARQRRDRVWIVGSDSERDRFQRGSLEAAERRTEAADEQLPRPVFPHVRAAISTARAWRADHGVSSRLDAARNRAIGNAIVPQVAEQFFRWIAFLERNA
ncbi:MAG: DNA cytosine methyltransferase [Verrucomicrobiota bacterium]